MTNHSRTQHNYPCCGQAPAQPYGTVRAACGGRSRCGACSKEAMQIHGRTIELQQYDGSALVYDSTNNSWVRKSESGWKPPAVAALVPDSDYPDLDQIEREWLPDDAAPLDPRQLIAQLVGEIRRLRALQRRYVTAVMKDAQRI